MNTTLRSSLWSLALGGFGIGLTEFVVMGLLPDLAGDLGVSIPSAGYLISIYALGVVVGAPVLVLWAGRRPPKRILLGLMILFTLFNGASALAPGFKSLLALRFLSGLPHGAYFGVGAVVAARLAGPQRAASAFAVMLGGLTIANVVGVPLATYVGHHYGWRSSFGLVALVGVSTFAAIARYVPALADDQPSERSHPLAIFGRADLWWAIVITSVGFGGFFSWFTYVAPLLTVEAKLPVDAVPWIMSLAGVGMTIGNYAGGRLSDRLGSVRAITWLMATMMLTLILNAACAAHPYVLIPLAAWTGANAMAMGAPLQMLLIQSSRGAELLGSSIGQAAFNVGNTLGAFLGGVPLVLGYGYASTNYVGAGLAGAGFLLATALGRRRTAAVAGPV